MYERITIMDKKFSFSEQPLTSKIIYGVVIGILCVSAVVVGIVAANSRRTPAPEPDSGSQGSVIPNEEQQTPPPDNTPVDPVPVTPAEPTLISPVVGTVVTEHSLSIPVFSDTLKEWRVHTGVDISTEENAEIYAAADGTVSAIYTDPMYGVTVEITHQAEFKTVYSNLNQTLPASITVGSQVKSGDLIGTVGDTAMYELAEEPHLHFGVKIKGVSVNPLDYFSEDSKKASLGIG